MSRNATVAHDLDLLLVVDGTPTLPVATRLAYDIADPYAVTMAFSTGDGSVTWVFARDLLTDGLLEPVGSGDVTVSPDDGAVLVTLRSPGGRAEFYVDAFELAAFLDETTALIPRGQESAHLRLDDEIIRLFEAA
jgi:hypothetical protein